MPTIITHGVVALAAAAKAKGVRALSRWGLLLACALCAIFPDVDYIGLVLHVQYNSLFGHRGFTHSFFFAALLAGAAAWAVRPREGNNWQNTAKLFLLLFAVTASHGLLDAFTDGGEGVAFFSPFSNHRYFFPFRPVMVSPLGIGAFFRLHGLIILLDELLLVILPIGLLLYGGEILRWARARKAAAVAVAVVLLGLVGMLRGLYTMNNLGMSINTPDHPLIDLYAKQYPDGNMLEKISREGIPGGRLVTNFGEFAKLGLLNRRLESAKLAEHWAAGFWPNWYGGIAGRWQDPSPFLLLRTFVGYGVPDAEEILGALRESAADPAKRDFLFRLAPTEKYDLALGDYSFSATKSMLAVTHNAAEWPKYWFGLCNGMAAAGKFYREPHRTVEVVNPNGFRLRFHPNDVKALLGFALADASRWGQIGTYCTINGPEAKGCRLNPGALLLATMNRLGLAQDSFIVDGFSGTRKQFYLYDAGTVEVKRGPRPVSDWPGWALPTPVKQLVEVRFRMDWVSTLLADKEGGVPDGEAKGEGYFRKVGRVVAPRELDAVIALDESGEVLGGGWLGEQDVPDLMYFPDEIPTFGKGDRLRLNEAFSWSLIRDLYFKSVSAAKSPGVLDLSL